MDGNDKGQNIPWLMPTANTLEDALDDVLRPLKAAAGVFWAFNGKPESQEQQTIIDLCLLMEDAACQIEYLIDHATVEGKGVAFASLNPPYTRTPSEK